MRHVFTQTSNSIAVCIWQKKTKKSINLIASNKKSSFDYFLERHFQAGIALEGWEIKSIRAGRVQLKESYVIFKKLKPTYLAATLARLVALLPMLMQTQSAHENYFYIKKKFIPCWVQLTKKAIALYQLIYTGSNT